MGTINTYKKKDLLSSETVQKAKSSCVQCGCTISAKDSPMVMKFYSKAPVYLHHKCVALFKSTLRDY